MRLGQVYFFIFNPFFKNHKFILDHCSQIKTTDRPISLLTIIITYGTT